MNEYDKVMAEISGLVPYELMERLNSIMDIETELAYATGYEAGLNAGYDLAVTEVDDT